MTIIETDKSLERWDTLPDAIREAIVANENDQIIAAVAESRGVSKEKISLLARVSVYVFMGFIHADDVGQEIQEALGIPASVASAIAADLKQKLFAKYQKQLDTLYTPPGSLPRIIDLASTPLPSTPPPVPVANIPVVPVTVTPIPAPAQSAPGKIVPPTTTTTAAPAPFMMHEESTAAPLAGGAGFKLNVPTNTFGGGQIRKTPVPMPPKTVRLEIGAVPVPPKPAAASFQTKAPESRVVHYTDLRTILAPGVAAVPAAAPFAPPTPPVPIKPPAPAVIPVPVPPTPPAIRSVFVPPKPVSAPITPVPPPPVPVPPMTPKPPKVVNFTAEEVK